MSSTNTTELFFDVQQKTDKQHILDNPDTYIGSVENVDTFQIIPQCSSLLAESLAKSNESNPLDLVQ